MRVVESTCHKIFLDGHRIISLLPIAVIACCSCIVGMSKRWRPESLRRESRCRAEGVTDFGHFPAQSGPMEGQVLQLASCCIYCCRETAVGCGVSSTGVPLGTWVRWYLDCIMMYGPRGFSRVRGLSLARQLTGELGGRGSCLNGIRRKHGASSSLRATRPVSSVLLT